MADDDPEVDIEFDVTDKASPKLTRLEKNVARLDKIVTGAQQRFTGMLTTTLGFGALFGLSGAIAGAKNYVNHVERMHYLTGLSAQESAGLSTALQEVGVSAELVEATMGRMVKRGAQLSEGNKSLIKLAKGYGVSLEGGPVKALTSMASAVEKGKLGIAGVQRLTGLTGGSLVDMFDAMKKGPKALSEAIDRAKEKNSFFNEDTVGAAGDIDDSMTRISLAWKRLTSSVLVAFAPTMTKLADKMESSIDKWSGGAQKFGAFMVKHMDTLIAMAKTYAKIMMANMISSKLTGVGLIGLGGKAWKAGGAAATGIAARGGVGGAMAAGLANLGPFITGLFKLRPLIMVLSRFTIIGGIALAAFALFKAISDNVGGLRDRLGKIFGGMWESLKRIGGSISSIFGGNGSFSGFIELLGRGLGKAIEILTLGIRGLLFVVEKLVAFIDRFVNGDMDAMAKMPGFMGDYAREQKKRSGKLGGLSKESVDKFKAMQAKKRAPEGAPENMVYQDFRGSRFAITQEFAEGFDPDRIAVAFANDVASIGERKLQSGFSPLFAVR